MKGKRATAMDELRGAVSNSELNLRSNREQIEAQKGIYVEYMKILKKFAEKLLQLSVKVNTDVAVASKWTHI